jgi:pimeloyl-ACP methyl ester carboxylesterase
MKMGNAMRDFDRRHVLGAGAVMAAALGAATRGVAKDATDLSVSHGYATVSGLRVYYEVHGGALLADKVPMVLLHGGATTIETAFPPDLIPRFTATRPVIAIEQQCHGHTGDRKGPATINRMVEDTSGVLARLGVKQADFLGHSLGGLIATGMAIRHPDQVRSVTALSSFYVLDGMLPELARMQRNPANQPSAALIPLLPTEADFAAWRASYERSNPDPKSFDRSLAKLNAMLAQWPGWSEAELRSIRASFLVAIGDNDFVRIEHAAAMKRLIAGAQLAVLPGTTHMNSIKRGAWLATMIEARLASA